MASYLGAFTTQLLRFFEDLSATFPEERDIKMAVTGVEGLKLANPKMCLDLFYEYVYVPISDAIYREDTDFIIEYAKKTITTQFNDMYVALMIFDKYWHVMSETNRSSIWKYLKVLCVLCEKARGLPPKVKA